MSEASSRGGIVASIPEAAQRRMNILLLRLARCTDQAECDRMEAEVVEIEIAHGRKVLRHDKA